MTADRVWTIAGITELQRMRLAQNGYRIVPIEIEDSASPEERGGGGDSLAFVQKVADQPCEATAFYAQGPQRAVDEPLLPAAALTDGIERCLDPEWNEMRDEETGEPIDPESLERCGPCEARYILRTESPAAPSEPAPLDVERLAQSIPDDFTPFWEEQPTDIEAFRVGRWRDEGGTLVVFNRVRFVEAIADEYACLQSTPTPTEGSE